MTSSSFQQSWLWRQAFESPVEGVSPIEQRFYREQFLFMRERAKDLVAQISGAMPGLTVHDITHLDALWETGSLVAEDSLEISPAETFVFGAAVLLHDSAMSLAAFPRGIEDLQRTTEWRDAIAVRQRRNGIALTDSPSSDIVQEVIPEVLRQLHAKQAEVLAAQGWRGDSGEIFHLIDRPETRTFYGTTIGQIAHSHWWSVGEVERELVEDLGPYPGSPGSRIDKVKIACLLRLADALHLDNRRAPIFLRALTRPTGLSATHWSFQEKLAFPIIEHEAVVFSSSAPFAVTDSDAWWLAYDTLCAVDKELQDVDSAMQTRNRGGLFKGRRVRGAGSPGKMARSIPTRGWKPVDTLIRASDIPALVETLGGEKLYGDDPTIAIRELIQNASDAIQARRRLEKRGEDWGAIKISLVRRADGHWLTVEDTGVGMSDRVMTGPLIDFGSSFWRSTLATSEFPGLAASGMDATGRYGIGFFSVFMIGTMVRVISRRYDAGMDSARVLEFRHGTTSRPILMPAARDEVPLDGGTRIEVRLKRDPRAQNGIFRGAEARKLSQLIAHLAPSISVSITTSEATDTDRAVDGDDWKRLDESDLWDRLNPTLTWDTVGKKRGGKIGTLETLLDGRGEAAGRAFILPSEMHFEPTGGWITVGGLRASHLRNVQGVLLGTTLNAARDKATPIVSVAEMARWATRQRVLIEQARADELYKAQCAEVILECGGDIGNLPVVRKGVDRWLSRDEFTKIISELDEIPISFDGEFSYEEDDDEVLPREFRTDFAVSAEIFVVPKHDGAILKVGGKTWPGNASPRYGGTGHLAAVVRAIVYSVFGADCPFEYERIVVGNVGPTPIEREMQIFRRAEPLTDETEAADGETPS